MYVRKVRVLAHPRDGGPRGCLLLMREHWIALINGRYLTFLDDEILEKHGRLLKSNGKKSYWVNTSGSLAKPI